MRLIQIIFELATMWLMVEILIHFECFAKTKFAKWLQAKLPDLVLATFVLAVIISIIF